MKSLYVSSIATLMVSTAAASLAVVEPWSDTTWKSGGEGAIHWTSDPKEYGNAMCHIQLMNGSPTNGQIVADITEPQSPIPCTANEFKVGPLNDFTQGDYWIRIGQGEKWTYSHMFKFDGKGTVDTHSITKPQSIRLSGNPPVSGGAASASPRPISSAGSPSAVKPSASPSASRKMMSGSKSMMSASHMSASMSASAKASPSASSTISEHNAVKDLSGADSFHNVALEMVLGTVVAGLMTYFI